jgi:hypothetical protein
MRILEIMVFIRLSEIDFVYIFGQKLFFQKYFSQNFHFLHKMFVMNFEFFQIFDQKMNFFSRKFFFKI